jgi:hypothetical protein
LQAQSDGRIFVTTGDGESIVTANLDGSNPRALIDLDAVLGESDYFPSAIVASGSRLIWEDGLQDGIHTAGMDGSNPQSLIGGVRPSGIYVSGSRLFWTITDAIHTAGLDGSNPTRMFDLRAVFGNGAFDD